MVSDNGATPQLINPFVAAKTQSHKRGTADPAKISVCVEPVADGSRFIPEMFIDWA